jgi:hypothetical protein
VANDIIIKLLTGAEKHSILTYTFEPTAERLALYRGDGDRPDEAGRLRDS